MKISVAIPTYNGGKFLREQLDSIYHQTRVPDEVVVVDDCSKDNTVIILKEYADKYGLKYYQNESNLGYNKNFEKAIRLCTGDIIALCDQDDYWFPTKIADSYSALMQYPMDEPSCVSSFSISTDENLKPLPRISHDLQSGDWRLNLTRYYSQGCTLMFNRALCDYILPFPEEMIYDAYIGLTAAMVGNRYYINKELMYYRLYGGNSLANEKPKSPYSILNRLKLLHAYMPAWYTKEEQYRYLHILKQYQGQNFKKERIPVLEKVIRLFEVGKVRRLFLFLSLDGPNLYQKLKTSIGLVLKIIFFIKDEY